jgi:hypothetical protein
VTITACLKRRDAGRFARGNAGFPNRDWVMRACLLFQSTFLKWQNPSCA